MTPELIFYPVAVLVFWTMLVLLHLGLSRMQAVRRKEIAPAYFRAYRGDAPERLVILERHYRNLLELPLLFYSGALIAYVTGGVDGWILAFAWAFVALRLLHSMSHLGGNRVRIRFRLFLAGFAVLAVFWLGILVRL